jgi:hypothetical protein
MLSYKDYEKKVYDWLQSKHNQDSSFTFTLRQKGSKGAETDYFIGTEKSKYFSTSFWYLPVAFPGSSGDCMGLLFEYTKTGYHYIFEFTQTRAPHDDQNKAALKLVELLQPALETVIGFQRQPTVDNKMFTLRAKTPKASYDTVEEMLVDIENDMKIIFPIVENTIGEVKKSYPSFKAIRITTTEFELITKRFEERLKRYENSSLTPEDDLEFNEFIKKFDANDVKVYFDFLKEMLDTMEVHYGDERLLFTYRQNRLNFTIGQRYSFYLNKSDKKSKFGVLSKDKLNESSTLFAGTSNVPWFSLFDEFTLNEREKQSIVQGFTEQLSRSKKSSYREHNNDEFERAAFNHSIGTTFQTTNNTIMAPTNFPLNQILYGPPGTGKTYHTVLEAAKIVTGNETISYQEALGVFKSNLDSQIEFITFHQNYSYEDFIQGLRPDTENGSALTFEKKDGVFKRIADRALKNLLASENPASVKKDFDLVFHELIQPLNEGDVEEVEIKMKKSSFFITEVGEKSIDFRKSIGDSKHTLSINTLRKMYNTGGNDIILGGLQPYYNPILELLLEKGKSQAIAIPRKNYVIIIDEINRANISRVFGELITLIEEDKRSHGAIPMRVTLPSGDSFIVPSNLYIIGTMNTADKSIALLDIALRRRFEFVPMYPEVNLVKEEYKVLFEKMNKTIKDKKNYDFTIGHAYFMDDTVSLEKIINHKVIPLLLEYFMNSEEQVKEILASAGIAIGGWPLKMIQ